jgi:hypothetical protein
MQVDRYEMRRLKLLALRDRDFGRSNSALARKIGKDASYVARMLYPIGKHGKKRIGEEVLDSIERAFAWPRGWMDADAPLPAPQPEDIRRTNLQRWVHAHSIPTPERDNLLRLAAAGAFSAAEARRLEQDYHMGDGYLDAPWVPHRASAAQPVPAANRAAPRPQAEPVWDGAFFARARNGALNDELSELSMLSADLRHILMVYSEGSAARQEAMRQVAQLPEPDVSILLATIQALK